MGNKLCCDESHEKLTEMEKIEDDVTFKIAIVNRERAFMQKEKNEQPLISSKDDKTEKNIPLIQSNSKVEEPSMSPPQVELPKLSTPINQVLHKYHFFEQDLSETIAHRCKFGEDIYEGQLDELLVKPHGLGRMFKSDGSYYVGYFSHGQAHGRGIFIMQDGSFYEGEFMRNMAQTPIGFQGKFQSGEMKYVGGFRNNTFHGLGVENGANYKFEGKYMDGVKVEGKLIWTGKDGNYQYLGTFNQRNNFHGKGILIEPSGTYSGDFVDGFKHGQGFYQSNNGSKYQGQYVKNERCGKGIVYNFDDTIAYEGDVKNGLPHGKGKVKNIGGHYEMFYWVEGINTSMINNDL